MIKSKTKYEATIEEIQKLFSFHKLGNVTDVAPLGNVLICGTAMSYTMMAGSAGSTLSVAFGVIQ